MCTFCFDVFVSLTAPDARKTAREHGCTVRTSLMMTSGAQSYTYAIYSYEGDSNIAASLKYQTLYTANNELAYYVAAVTSTGARQ